MGKGSRALLAVAAALAPTTVAAAGPGPCPVACDYTSGAGCRDAYEPAETIYPLEVESMDGIAVRVARCDRGWHGARGCYALDVAPRLSDLGLVASEIGAVVERSARLPEAARQVCDRVRPTLADKALDDVRAWCAVGQGECSGALDMARSVLRGMPDWQACVERMESRVAENAAAVCEAPAARPSAEPMPTAAPAPLAPLAPAPAPLAPAPAPVTPTAAPTVEPVAQAPRVAPAPAPGPSVRRVVEAEPIASYGPGRASDEPSVFAGAASAAPTQTTSAQLGAPRPVVERRTGQVELSLAPFSGVLAIRDPGTGQGYDPLAASIGIGFNVVAALASGIDLEIGIMGRGTFASSALQEAASVGLDQLDTESGTALVLEIEPAVTVLTRYVGVGIVTDFRWDSIGVTSLTTGLVRNDASGVAGGARFVAGFGLLDDDLRFLAMLDYLFLGGDEATLRATLRAELGPALITGSYTDYARLGAAEDAYAVDHLQLTVGFRMVF